MTPERPPAPTVARWVAEGGQITRLPPAPERTDNLIDEGRTAQRSWAALRRAGQDTHNIQETP